MKSLRYRTVTASSTMILRRAVNAEGRAELLELVTRRFLQRFGAQVADDSPELVGGFDPRGRLVAAFGLRDARSGFFCEHYLAAPIETLLGRHFQRPVARSEVVEVTHLCAVRPGCLAALTPLLPPALLRDGYRYLTATATDCLAGYFARRGLPTCTLAEASADALPAEERGRWGNYYSALPRVIAGDLLDALGDRRPGRASPGRANP